MKKKYLGLVLAGIMTLSLVACSGAGGQAAGGASTQAGAESSTEAGADNSADAGDVPTTGLANPWTDITEEEADARFPNLFKIPEGAENVRWSMNEVADNTVLPGTMIQASFDLDGVSYTARMQPVAGEDIVDISGMYYDWTVSDEGMLSNWGGGKMAYKSYRYVGDGEYIDVCNWFDIETGYAYSLSAQAADLDGFDIIAMVDQMYAPEKQFGANAPDYSAIEIDITGCDTFTQIVDQKLTDGMGYANVTITGTDVLLVSSGCYDNLDGNMAAIDSVIYAYGDNGPYELGKVSSDGTAYPITVKDGYLYTGGHHWMCKYAIADGKLMVMEEVSELYDENGNATYYYNSDDGGDYSNFDSAEAEKIFDELIQEMVSGEIVNYSVVSK